MTQQISDAIGGVSIAVIVQALITLILTITIVGLIAVERTPNEQLMVIWYVCVGLWLPLPDSKK